MIDGFLDACLSLGVISTIINNISIKSIYLNIVLYNSICIAYYFLYLYIVKLFPSIKYIWYACWTIPQLMICNVYNDFYTNKMINLLYPEKDFSNNQKWTYIIVNTFYSQLILIGISIYPYIISIHSLFGVVSHFIFYSILYSFYCHIPFYRYHKVGFYKQIMLTEENLLYYIGYGTFFAYLKLNFDYVLNYHIISIIYPLLIMNPFIIREYPNNNNYLKIRFPFFKISIWISDCILKLIVYSIRFYMK